MHTNEWERYNNLDLIRLIGAAMIFGVHLFQVVDMGEWVSSRAAVGAEAVYLFFVLSGYGICNSLDRESDIKRYIKKRLIGIVPGLWITLLLWFVYEVIVLRNRYGLWYWILYATGLNYIITGASTVSRWHGDMGNLWTMTFFLIFYIIAPFLYKILKKLKWGGMLLFLVFVILSTFRGRIPQLFIGGYDVSMLATAFCGMISFVYGMLLYHFSVIDKDWIWLFCISILFALSVFTFYKWEIIYSIMIFLASRSKNFIKMDRLRSVVSYLGKNAFLVYLSHGFVLELYRRYMLPIGASKLFGIAVIVTVTLLVVIVEAKIVDGIRRKVIVK